MADWQADVVAFFPLAGELQIPWRWINAGAHDLGNWLLAIRPYLATGKPIDIRTAALGVEWVQLDGRRDDALRHAAAAVHAPDEAEP